LCRRDEGQSACRLVLDDDFTSVGVNPPRLI
jgi:hypothetical protein